MTKRSLIRFTICCMALVLFLGLTASANAQAPIGKKATATSIAAKPAAPQVKKGLFDKIWGFFGSDSSDQQNPNPPPSDADNDGVADANDNCVNIANSDQRDTDRNGIGDACSAIPAQEGQVIQQADFTGSTSDSNQFGGEGGDAQDNPMQRDTDLDGISDANDNCPRLSNPDQRDSDNNGIGDACQGVPAGEADMDGDGIADSRDNCPLISNSDQLDSNGNGRGDLCEQDDVFCFGGSPNELMLNELPISHNQIRAVNITNNFRRIDGSIGDQLIPRVWIITDICSYLITTDNLGLAAALQNSVIQSDGLKVVQRDGDGCSRMYTPVCEAKITLISHRIP